MLARADVRATWALGDSLALEVGATATRQRERRASRPSFVEAGLFLGIVWVEERLFREAAPSGAP